MLKINYNVYNHKKGIEFENSIPFVWLY